MRKAIFLSFIVAIIAFSALMLTKIIPYLGISDDLRFLSTKTDETLSKNYYWIAFYIHITSSWWVMLGGVFQFWGNKIKPFHRVFGKIYVFTILFLAAPAGLILAFFANGGLPSKVGFLMQCVVWWLLTYKAFDEIRHKNWLPHIEWTIRSYAVTLAAMSLRLESYTMVYVFHTKPIETYLTVTWLSWVGNLFLAEVLVINGLAKNLLKKIAINP